MEWIPNIPQTITSPSSQIKVVSVTLVDRMCKYGLPHSAKCATSDMLTYPITSSSAPSSKCQSAIESDQTIHQPMIQWFQQQSREFLAERTQMVW